MDIQTWTQRFFSESSKINWNFPNCNSIALEIIKDKFVTEETQSSIAMRKKDDYWETEWIELNVLGQLKCKNCKEVVFFIGRGNPEEIGYYDHKLDDYISDYETSFTPLFINPTIQIFEIPQKCPDLVKDEIIDSFKLYWTDLESCANKIRISLEHLMDYYKVKKYNTTSGKRNPISLHNRIKLFPNVEVKDILLAIKWIGNSGSHSKSKLETIDILETYKLYEFSLQKLFNNDEKEIKNIAKQINQRKGTRKR